MKNVLIFAFAILIVVGSREKLNGFKGNNTTAATESFFNEITSVEDVKHFEISNVSISAYTASKKECGKTDGITASGVMVHDGVIACNFLPFGTKVKIPGMFGDKVFTVYDRMAKKNSNNVDIYTKSLWRALRIGRSDRTIVVIN
jgi:3D (Asp-Asp-Asp) domain-containing protein